MHFQRFLTCRPVSRSRLLLLGTGLLLLSSTSLLAHGTLLQPMSRVYRVYKDDPENPTAPWAKAALAISDKNAIYTWNQISQNIPTYNHRSAVPDGQLASGGNSLYAGLDLVRPDWPATPVAAGNFQLLHWATAAHEPSYFDVYITKASYDPGQPLTWDNMEQIGSHVPYWKEAPNYWRLNITLPPRTGKHVLWVVWQRIDPVGEAFFMTSDIVFDGSVTHNPVVPIPANDPTLPETNYPTPTPDPETTPEAGPTPVPPYVAPTPPTATQTQIGNVMVEFSSSEAWIGGYNATLRITNLGAEPLESWRVGFTGEFVITSLWNARYLCAASDHTVTNPAWASTLAPGASATVGFIVSGPLLAPSNYTVTAQTVTPPPPATAASFAVELRYDSVWSGGFTGTIRLKNTGTKAVDGWTAAFGAPFNITSLWNGAYQKIAGVHTVSPAAWNRRIAPGQSIDIGFTGSGEAKPVNDIIIRTAP